MVIAYYCKLKVGLRLVLFSVLGVYKNEDQVESTEKRCSYPCVLVVVITVIPFLGPTWVSSSEYSRSGVDLTAHASLSDADSLLLHSFVDTSSVLILYQGELIDATNATVS